MNYQKWTIQNGHFQNGPSKMAFQKLGWWWTIKFYTRSPNEPIWMWNVGAVFYTLPLSWWAWTWHKNVVKKKTALGQLEKEQIIKRTCNLQKLSTCSTRFHTSAIFSTAERIRKIIPAHLKVKSLETMLFLGPIITQDSDPKTGIRQWLFCLRKIPWNAMEIMLQTRAVRGSQQGWLSKCQCTN